MQVLLYPDRGRVKNTYLSLLTDEVPGVVFTDWSARAVLQRHDIVHLHWPDVAWRTGPLWQRVLKGSLMVAALATSRLRGAAIVQTVHNLTPHDESGERVGRFFGAVLDRLVTAIQVLDTSTIERLDGRFEGRPISVVPHGHYRATFGRPQRRTGPPYGVFHVGFLRPYKGTDELIQTFAELGPEGWTLHVAGEAPDETRIASIQSGMATVNGTFRPSFLSDEEVTELAGECHLAVLPFRSIENSGSVLLALSLGLPVLAPNIGNLASLRDAVGDNWLQLYEPPLTAETLRSALDRAERRDPSAEPDLTSLSWESIRVRLAEAYRDVAL